MQYKDLNLKKLRDDNDLDFAHFTYQRGMCSCCYGPRDLPKRYWRGNVVPADDYDDYTYLLFKNADNGSGHVKRTDEIEDYTCIGWSFPMEKLEKVCKDLQAQLDDDYVVLMPPDEYSCILIMKVNSRYLEEQTKWHRMVDIREV
jgi:hypothetical protein